MPPVEYGYCCAGVALEPLRKGVRIKYREKICEPTKVYIVNPQMIGYRVRVHNSCLCNELVSLRNRHLVDRTLPEYDKKYMLSKFKEVSKDWAVNCQRISYREVVNCYKGAKKRMYTFASMEVAKHGVRHNDHVVRMFIKPDKYDDDITGKLPRAIQYRHARYNLVSASYLKPFEELFYKLESANGYRIVTKGLNPVQVADLLINKAACFKYPVFVSCDHSKFDSTINVDHLKFEHGVYNRSYRDTSLRLHLRKQLFNKGFSRNGIRYSVPGTRMSGDYNTGLGNCMINRAVLESLLIGVRHEIMLDGDDSVIILEHKDLNKINFRHFAKCGFTTEVSVSHDIQDVIYCKRKLCMSTPPIMVRNPVRALSNLAVTTYNYGALGFKRWALGALECERLSNPGIPIFRNLPSTNQRVIKDADYQRKMEVVSDKVQCTIAELSCTWGLSNDVCVMLEESVKKYLGWDCDNRIKRVIQTLTGKVSQADRNVTISAFTAQQASISQRFCSLCSTADECWSEIGSPDMGTTTIGRGLKISPGKHATQGV